MGTLATLLLGGMIALVGNQKLALFTGPISATWDKDQYIAAVQMKQNGATPADIAAQTGYWWGPDGRARTEIDDSGAKLIGSGPTLGQAIEHPALFQAYPEMRGISADVTRAGIFDSDVSGLYTPPSLAGPERIEVKAGKDKMLNATLHEIQHAIQNREHFVAGGIPAGATLLDLQIDPKLNATYLRIAGEAEARAASARQNLSPEQRRSIMPEKSYDVPVFELTTASGGKPAPFVTLRGSAALSRALQYRGKARGRIKLPCLGRAWLAASPAGKLCARQN